ncbi:MAG: cytochrome c biogenesis protein CcsA, partial [Rhodoferax sp.]
SLLAWITFAALLAGRYQFGWRGKQANRMLYTGTVFLLLAYVGSRFVLEVVLGRSA